jgi:argininosuccinate lyase
MSQAGDGRVFLEDARLGPRNSVLVEFAEHAEFPKLERLFDAYTYVDLAHAVMLVETGILVEASGVRLLAGLLRISEMNAQTFPWLPGVGSYLVHVEHWLTEHLGADIAGLLQTGRSRNDQDAAAERFYQRGLVIDLSEALSALLSLTLDLALDHAETIMPGYTHLQHAQPWTFGHYLMRQASIIERDLGRLCDLYRRTNLSALGGAANAGTSWPIDRRRTAALLGHDGIVVNSCDAGEFARDHIEETTACLSIIAADLGRFATDLYVWSSFEFGFVEIADGLAGTSSIMPQKKNPHSLERVKSVGGQAIGWLATVMGCQRPALSTDLDFTFGDDLLGGFARSTYGSIRLMQETLRTLTVHRERMRRDASAFWGTTSHLADELVRRCGLSFRAAHQIVGLCVRKALAAGQTPETLEARLLQEAAAELSGPRIELDDNRLRALLDGRNFIETRVSEGSVAPVQVRRHGAEMKERLAHYRVKLAERRRLVDSALSGLLARARELAGVAQARAVGGDTR